MVAQAFVVYKIATTRGTEVLVDLLGEAACPQLLACDASIKPSPPLHEPHEGGCLADYWHRGYARQRLWFLDRLEGATPRHNLPSAFRLEGTSPRNAFPRALDDVAARHEVRTSSWLRPATRGTWWTRHAS